MNVNQDTGQNPEQASILIVNCLQGESFAWERFVDRYLPQVVRTVDFVASEQARGLTEDQRSEIVDEIFRALSADHFDLLKAYDRSTHFDTYLSVVGQRIASDRLHATS